VSLCAIVTKSPVTRVCAFSCLFPFFDISFVCFAIFARCGWAMELENFNTQANYCRIFVQRRKEGPPEALPCLELHIHKGRTSCDTYSKTRQGPRT
jgi:hypothetical protein